MSDREVVGRPVGELTDEELEQQGTQAHETRNWVFLHGSAEQFAHHTTRMLELEQEYLRRHPKRTWQGSGGAPSDVLPDPVPVAATAHEDPELAFLERVAHAPGGRLHKLEAHQAAREVGLDRSAVARLYTAQPALLVTERQDRVITEAGRQRLAAVDPADLG
jgi:Family of unknown function (DUF6158)